MTALIQIVDENDKPVGAASQQEAWDDGLIHRIVRIMAEAPDGRILLQKRTPTMDLYPGCWDHSASGHVDAGEDYFTAARRETLEELGVEVGELIEIGTYPSNEEYQGRKLNRFNKVYKLALDPSAKLNLQAEEVADARWFTKEEIRQLIKDQPDKVTDGLSQVFARYY